MADPPSKQYAVNVLIYLRLTWPPLTNQGFGKQISQSAQLSGFNRPIKSLTYSTSLLVVCAICMLSRSVSLFILKK